MTAPFNAHPQPVQWAIILGLPLVALAMPFARRDDWIGWAAFLVIASYAVFLWVVLIVGLSLRFLEWYRGTDD